MHYQHSSMSFNFGSNWTLMVKTFLIVYGVIYVLELLLVHWLNIPIVKWLMIYPVSHESFGLWQIITHPFIHDPTAPIGFLINCLVFFFFAGKLEDVFGTTGFLTFFYFCAVGGMIVGLLLSPVSGFGYPYLGMTPSILAMITVFGLLYPEATILLMFVLPVKGKYISYGTILVTALLFLAKVNPHGPYHLGGILFGLAYLKSPKNLFNFRWWHLKYLQWRYDNVKKKRFKVYDGQKENRPKKPPTIH